MSIAFSAGNFVKVTEAIREAMAGAATTIIRRKTSLLENAVKKQVEQSLSKQLSNTIKSKSYPEGQRTSMSAKGIVYSKAIYKRPGGLVDIITFFDASAIPRVPETITGLGGKKFLALALPPAGKGKGPSRYPKPSDFPRGTFRVAPSLNKPGYFFLVFKKPPRDRAFLLVPFVKVGKRLDLQNVKDRILGNIEDNLETEYQRRLDRIASSL